MGEVVNLNEYRKARERAGKRQSASLNRLKHGERTGDRELEEQMRAAIERALDDAQLTPDDPASPQTTRPSGPSKG